MERSNKDVWKSAIRIVTAGLFIGFVSFALAFGILGDHKTPTNGDAEGVTAASPGTAGEGQTTDGTTSASPTEGETPADALAQASPVIPAGGTAPDTVTSPSTAPGVTTPPADVVTSPSTVPAPSPTAPPDTITQPSTAPGTTTPAPGAGTDDDEWEPPETDDDTVLPLALEIELPVLLGGLGIALAIRRRRK